MLLWSHYRFKLRLLHKARQWGPADFNGARNILLRNVVTLRVTNVATPDGPLSIEAVCY